MAHCLTLAEREHRDEIRRRREKEYRRAQRKTTEGKDPVATWEMPDRSNRQDGYAELSRRMRECPALRELADA